MDEQEAMIRNLAAPSFTAEWQVTSRPPDCARRGQEGALQPVFPKR